MSDEQRLTAARRRAADASRKARDARDVADERVVRAQQAGCRAFDAELSAARACNAAHRTKDPDMAEKMANEAEAYATAAKMAAGMKGDGNE